MSPGWGSSLPQLQSRVRGVASGALSTDDGITRVAELFPALVDKARRLSGQFA